MASKEELENADPNEWRIVFKKVSFSYGEKTVFQDFSHPFIPMNRDASRCVLIGESGTGKSSFIDLILGNIIPQEGDIWFNGNKLQYDDEDFLREHRASIGLVSQNLTGMLSYLTILENVRRPAVLKGYCVHDATEQAQKALEDVGLHEDVWRKYPNEISGGEKQRALIALMIVKRPLLLLCDEPTSALDGANSRRVIDAITKAKMPTIITTHNPGLFGSQMDGNIGVLFQNGMLDISYLKGDPLLVTYNSIKELAEARKRKRRPNKNKSQKKEQAATNVESKTVVADSSKATTSNPSKHG